MLHALSDISCTVFVSDLKI